MQIQYTENQKVITKQYFQFLVEALKIKEKMLFSVPMVTPSNPGFVVMGQRLGKEKLFEYIDKFGFLFVKMLLLKLKY